MSPSATRVTERLPDRGALGRGRWRFGAAWPPGWASSTRPPATAPARLIVALHDRVDVEPLTEAAGLGKVEFIDAAAALLARWAVEQVIDEPVRRTVAAGDTCTQVGAYRIVLHPDRCRVEERGCGEQPGETARLLGLARTSQRPGHGPVGANCRTAGRAAAAVGATAAPRAYGRPSVRRPGLDGRRPVGPGRPASRSPPAHDFARLRATAAAGPGNPLCRGGSARSISGCWTGPCWWSRCTGRPWAGLVPARCSI
jgi:hypothetical protein